MKKRILFTLLLILVFCFALTVAISAATYYVDVNGEIQSSANENTAYEFDTTVNSGTCYVSSIFLHDTTIVDLVIPDFEEITLMRIATWGKELKVYSVENKNAEYTTDMELQKNIKSLDIYEKIHIEGANNSTGSFMNWTGLEIVIFRGSFAYTTSSGGFTGCSSLKEFHFYGENINVPGFMISKLNYSSGAKLFFILVQQVPFQQAQRSCQSFQA